MAEDESNLILRLLREIRADQQNQGKRLVRVERRVDELHENVATALGMAAHSNVVVEQFGQRFDEFEDRLGALQRRVADLETKS